MVLLVLYWIWKYNTFIHASTVLTQLSKAVQNKKKKPLSSKQKIPLFFWEVEKTMTQWNFASLETAGPETEFFLIANEVDIKTFKMILLYFSHIFLINSIVQYIFVHIFYNSSSTQRFIFISSTNTFVGKYKDCLDGIIGWQCNFLFFANFIVDYYINDITFTFLPFLSLNALPLKI